MRKASFRFAAMTAVLLASATPALGFKQVEPAPAGPPSADVDAAASKTPGLSVAPAPTPTDLGTPMAADPTRPNDVQVFSFGVLPSLDFGLDVLYGHSTDPALDPAGKPDDMEDIGVVGTVKQRF